MGFMQSILDWLSSPALSFDGEAEDYWYAIAERERARAMQVHNHRHIHFHQHHGAQSVEEEIAWHREFDRPLHA